MNYQAVESVEPNLAEALVEITAAPEVRPGAAEPSSVSVDALVPADSPRTAGIDPGHVATLTEAEAPLPPIVVHRSTLRVVDGMHRLYAARNRGDARIAAYLVDVPEGELFALAVRLNTGHGRPLAYGERLAAADRLLREDPGLSDRRVAKVVGLSAKTIARVRGSTADDPQLNARIGLDGKTHPRGVAHGREEAGRLLQERPDASLREVARTAGISLGTAHDVKMRVSRGEDPMPSGRGTSAPVRRQGGRPNQESRAAVQLPTAELLRRLRKDPALRSTDSGRVVLRLLAMHDLGASDWAGIVMNLPTHCTYVVAALARQSAHRWMEIAEHLEQGGSLRS